MEKEIDEIKDKKEDRKYSVIIWICIVLSLIAVAFPVIFMVLMNFDFMYDLVDKIGLTNARLSNLALSGDYYGGITSGLLSFFSIIFVTIAMFMQKKELELQRNEITLNRIETQTTNVTMKKQQFENTFFNMIDLHHKILNDIEINNIKGRKALNEFIKKININYNSKVISEYIESLREDMEKYNNLNDIFELLWEINDLPLMKSERRSLQLEFEKIEEKFQGGDITFPEYEEKMNDLTKKGKEIEAQRKDLLLEKFKTDEKYRKLRVRKLNLDELKEKYNKNKFVMRYLKEFINTPSITLKKKAFEDVYTPLEPIIGHYFRNLYHICKLIDKYSEFFNEKEQSEYRSILRAQLSSKELLALFYNIAYSNKGEGFYILIKGAKFFDDHLDNESFIWLDDLEMVKKIDSGS